MKNKYTQFHVFAIKLLHSKLKLLKVKSTSPVISKANGKSFSATLQTSLLYVLQSL